MVLGQAIMGAAKLGNAISGIARNVSRVDGNLRKWSLPKQPKKTHFKSITIQD